MHLKGFVLLVFITLVPVAAHAQGHKDSLGQKSVTAPAPPSSATEPSAPDDTTRQGSTASNSVFNPGAKILRSEWFQTIAIGTALVVFAIVTFVLLLLFVFTLWQGHKEKRWVPILENHFLGAVGIPIATIVSFVVVQLLSGLHGEIKVTAVGVTFSGATGPVVLWAICFLVEVAGMRILWGKRVGVGPGPVTTSSTAASAGAAQKPGS